jgi:membrane-associated protein
MTDMFLGLLPLYGAPVLFGILILTSAGLPGPDSLLLLVVGSFVAQGEMILWQVLVLGSAGAILGDQIGFFVGQYGGRPLVRRITDRLGGHNHIKRAEAFSERWGGAGIFLSRWLVPPLGPWINISSGITGYPWIWFIFWDVLGKVLWVALYVMLGNTFSDQVESASEILGQLTWVIVGVLATTVLGCKLFQYYRAPAPTKAENPA